MSGEHDDFIPWYRHDTARWLKLSLAARGAMAEIARKLNRKGELRLSGGLPDLAFILRLSWEEELGPAVAELVAAGRVIWDGSRYTLIDPEFEERKRKGSAERMAEMRSKRKAEGPGEVVYFVQAGEDGLIKIGWTNNLHDRIVNLQAESSLPLRLLGHLPGGLALEQRLHVQFANHRERGEWFRPATDIVSFLSDRVTPCDRVTAPGRVTPVLSDLSDLSPLSSGSRISDLESTGGADPPGWWQGVLDTLATSVEAIADPAAAWLRYRGHRAGKAIAMTPRDAEYWLTTVIIGEQKNERQRAREREDGRRFRADPPKPPEPTAAQRAAFAKELAERVMGKKVGT